MYSWRGVNKDERVGSGGFRARKRQNIPPLMAGEGFPLTGTPVHTSRLVAGIASPYTPRYDSIVPPQGAGGILCVGLSRRHPSTARQAAPHATCSLGYCTGDRRHGHPRISPASSPRYGEGALVDSGQRELAVDLRFQDGHAYDLDYEDYH